MNILLTGGTGFIGRHLRQRLARDGHRVIDLARNPEKLERLENSSAIRFDLCRLDQILLPCGYDGCDVLIHLAQGNAAMPDGALEIWRVNADATAWLLELARRNGVKRFCLASTGSVYAPLNAVLARTPRHEETPVGATSYYAASKLAAEQLVRQYQSYFQTVIWRLFGPYGPRQEKRLIPTLIDRVRTGRPIKLNQNGSPAMNFVYIDDVVEAIVRSLSLDQSAVINIGGSESLDIEQASTVIAEVLGMTPAFERTDAPADDYVGDIRRAHATLNWQPTISFRDGIAATVAASA